MMMMMVTILSPPTTRYHETLIFHQRKTAILTLINIDWGSFAFTNVLSARVKLCWLHAVRRSEKTPVRLSTKTFMGHNVVRTTPDDVSSVSPSPWRNVEAFDTSALHRYLRGILFSCSTLSWQPSGVFSFDIKKNRSRNFRAQMGD